MRAFTRISICVILLIFTNILIAKEIAPTNNDGSIGFLNRIQVFFLGYTTPEMFGAKGDGVTDDTAPIQYAINYAANHHIKRVKIPRGQYLINVSGRNSDGKTLVISEENHYFDKIGVGIILKSHVNIELEEDAVLIAKPTDIPEYAVVYVGEKEGIVFEGGAIIGDLDSHYGKTGQQGMCVWIQSSSDITIRNCDISKGWGDCIDIGCKWDSSIPYGSNRSKNIIIEDCTLHDSRRQGISVVGCEGLLVKNCDIYNIEGDAPQAGIDLEVNFKDYPNKNCVFDGLNIHDCKGGGIIGYTTPTNSVKIIKSNVQSAHLTCVDGIDIANSTIGYVTFDNYYNVAKDTISIKGSSIKQMTLCSAAPYLLNIDNCTIGNDKDQPSIAFIKRDNGKNENEVVDIIISNSQLSAIHNVNLFSISPLIHPNSIDIVKTAITQFKPSSLFANSISIKKSYLLGRSLTMDFCAPNVSFVDNTIDAVDCLENINGYILKFKSDKSVVFTGNEIKGAKREGQFIVIPNEYSPECVISGNNARQYNSIGSISKKAKVNMNGNVLHNSED